MTMHMAGWVEILRPPYTLGWSPAINVNAVVWSDDLGLKPFVRALPDAPYKPVAQGRGLPGDVSSQVKRDIESYGDAGAGIVEECWYAWNELEPFAHADDLNEDIRTLFALAETLASHFGDRNVRFVVWFFA